LNTIDLSALNKLYYTIGEVALLIGAAPSVIRYWEAEFNTLKPSKNSRGERKYTQKDVHLILDIHYLLKEKGYTIEGAKKELIHQKNNQKEEKVLLTHLKSVRAKLNTLLQKIEERK